MIGMTAKRLGLMLGLALISATHLFGQGTLIIVGGSLRASNAEVYDALTEAIAAAPLEGDRIGIIGAASGKPTESSERFRQTLIRYGVDPAKIDILPLALRDDSTTADVDESEWRVNALSEALAYDIRENYRALWFTGGDQARIIEVLRPEGEKSLVLEAIESVYAAGGIIGGSSAGAAMQSEVMITGGSSDQALQFGIGDTYSGMVEQTEGRLSLGEGLGFFPEAVIDQHFDRKARLGRLVVALWETKETFPQGFGIAEDTALIYDGANRRATVAGSRHVLQIDVREAERRDTDYGAAFSNIRLNLLASGDQLDFETDMITPHPGKSGTRASPYWNVQDTRKSGPLSPYTGDLTDAIGFLLVDNAADQVELLSRVTRDRAYRVVLRADADTEGYWGYLDGTLDSYSATGVLLDLEPVGLILTLP